MYLVYIIYSNAQKQYYTGFTTNLEKRLKQHSSNKKIFDFQVIHAEMTKSRKLARELEKYFKSGFGREIRSEIVKYRNMGL